MDFTAYAQRLVAMVNASPATLEELRDHLSDDAWLRDMATDADPARITRLRRDLGEVFGDDDRAAVATINRLLGAHPAVPSISGDGDDVGYHLHVADDAAALSRTVAAAGLFGLAVLACDLGPDRFGTCADDDCDDYFIDTSTNRSRRYCSSRCSNRANVAAWRARQT